MALSAMLVPRAGPLLAGLYPVYIVGGEFHNCALRNDGSVACWGSNQYGQLGIGSTSHIGDGANEMGNNLQKVDLGTGQ